MPLSNVDRAAAMGEVFYAFTNTLHGHAERIRAIKAIRTLTGCGLKEGKELFECFMGERAFDRPNYAAPAAAAEPQYYTLLKRSHGDYDSPWGDHITDASAQYVKEEAAWLVSQGWDVRVVTDVARSEAKRTVTIDLTKVV